MSAQGLPAHILGLFQPRPPAEPLPISRIVHKRQRQITGLADLVDQFEEEEPPKRPEYISPRERKILMLREKFRKHQEKLDELRRDYDPRNDPNAANTSSLATLFVARISYDTSEKKLRREFEQYGLIKRLKMVYDIKTQKPRGYGFIEFEEERDVRTAFKQADGRKIDGRYIMVDVERGRTCAGWYPRRLGGGRGGARKLKGDKAKALMDAIQGKGKDRRKSRSRRRSGDRKRRDRDGDRDRDRDRDRERDRPRDKDKEREKDRDREKVRDREKEREKDGDREKDRHRERKRSRDREKERSRDRGDRGDRGDRDRGDRDRGDRDRGDRDRDRRGDRGDRDGERDRKRRR